MLKVGTNYGQIEAARAASGRTQELQTKFNKNFRSTNKAPNQVLLLVENAYAYECFHI